MRSNSLQHQLDLRVEGGERFLHEQHLRTVGKCARKTDALFRSARRQESRTSSDRHTRVRVTLPADKAIIMWRQLADDVPSGHCRVVYDD
jgi:hypothetical protein